MTDFGWSRGAVLVQGQSHVVQVRAQVDPAAAPKVIISGALSESAAHEASVRVLCALNHTQGSTQSFRVHVLLHGVPQHATAIAGLDLAIVAAIKRGLGECLSTPVNAVFVGELDLSGRVRAVPGVLCHALQVMPTTRLVVPLNNAYEAGLALNAEEFPELCYLAHIGELTSELPPVRLTPLEMHEPRGREELPEALRGVLDRCQTLPRVLLVGPPGCGRTVVARRLASASPPLTRDEALEVASIQSAAGFFVGAPVVRVEPPFRAPHHTISDAGLIGTRQRFGELRLARHGVLMLDELSEFRRATLGALADALGKPSNQPRHLVAAAHPCPCGYHGAFNRTCTCSPDTRARHDGYLLHLAELLNLTRIDMPAPGFPRPDDLKRSNP